MAGWEDPAHRLDGQRIAELFAQVDWQIGLTRPPESERIELAVCGGAAMCYQVAWRGTGDVDVMCPPMPPELREAVRTVARRRGLPADWMNDAASRFARYRMHLATRTLFEGQHIRVRAPDNRYLLGMKVQSRRAVDQEDILWLMKDTGLHRASDLHDAARHVCESTGQVWNPNRAQRRFIKRQARAHKRAARRDAR